MYSEVYSMTIAGLDAAVVKVETDVGVGIPYFEMSGYLANQVREAKERVRVAIRNSGIELRPQRIVVNISPADIRKAGTGFDLPIAVGILAANNEISKEYLESSVIIGELSLDGSVNGVNGVLPSVIRARECGFKRCIVPLDNLYEGNIIDGIEVLGVDKLANLIKYLNGNNNLCKQSCNRKVNIEDKDSSLDYLDVKGQLLAKRATLIAVAGMHNIMYIGAPGSGKTMLAKRIPSIMPELTFEESLELTKVYSVAGKLPKEGGIIGKRPFRCPHHSITQAALLGGGKTPMPGEITLAAKGVLFLDELTQYPTQLLEALRQPLEDKNIRMVRLLREYEYPADFMLVAAINPCKCGYYPDRSRCKCNDYDIDKYLGKISQPMWDRFDLNVQVATLEYEDISAEIVRKNDGERDLYSTLNMRSKVERAREVQMERFKDVGIKFNSAMDVKQVEKFCELGKSANELMKLAYERLNMTGRGYNKVLKVARTIADLDGEEKIGTRHISEAISYRSYGKR